MRKLILPIVAIFSTGAFTQTYFEDDFSGGLDSWMINDSDGDGFEWEIIDYGDGLGIVASSASWDSGAGILFPDNYMTAGPIDLSEATGEVFVTWKVKGQDQLYADEKYSVYASTSAEIVDVLGSPINFNEVIGVTDGDYVSRQLNVSDLVGEANVYITFRHHDVSDEYRLNIDDVNMMTLPEFEIEMVANTMYPLTAPGSVEITGIVKNSGYGSITEFEVDWNDGVAHSSTITATIDPGDTYNFTHPIDLVAVSGSVYDMTICVSIPDDADETNNCSEASVSCSDVIPDKYVVGEEKTGTWCGFCPRGALALEEMESEDRFIGIAVHNGDPMTVPIYDSSIDTYVPGGYPGAGVDRVISGDPSDFMTMFNERKTILPFASVDVSFADVGSNYEVTVSATFVVGVSGDYRLAAVITQDNVTGVGAGYNQANYYSGGSYGDMGGYEDLTDPVPAADMIYDHVAVALGNNEILGEAGSLPAEITSGSTESFTYIFPKEEGWNIEWLHFVGMLVNGSTGEIINARTTHSEPSGINENESNFNISLYPNPVSETARIRLELETTSNVKVEIFNNLGAIVYSNSSENLTAGSYIYNVDVMDFETGMYTVRTTTDNSVKTLKLSVK